jgi:molybdate/tungstate transport system substrate-binding protein
MLRSRLGRLACATSVAIAFTAALIGPRSAQAAATVNVLYAGSLVNLNEHVVGPAFTKSTGYGYQGEGMGSAAAANQIKAKVQTPDVFESAAPSVNTQDLMGAANGNYVSWFLVFAHTRLVIGFSPKSKFAADFKKAQQGKMPWYQVLEEPGVRIGRTDPVLDPKGADTLIMGQLAATYYHVTGLGSRLFGANGNTAQIFPEETLVARLQAGQLDAGVFYLSEVLPANLPYINLPSQIDMGELAYARTYATASYTSRKGAVTRGAPILYTVTIPSTVKHLSAAEAFIHFVLAGQGRTLYNAAGVLGTQILVGGDKTKVPAALAGLIQGNYTA